jgi:imidazolonepropionase-like amidohydrolase
VFVDWSTDYRGRVNSGFTGDDPLTYAPELLERAVAAVHELGGRVAAHCFTRAGAEVAIGAGVDSLEHGWGVDRELVLRMAERRVAWAPLVGIAGHMWRIARRDGEPERAVWIEGALDELARFLPEAEARGVTLLAGTDIFPQVTVADEIRELHALGVSRPAALAAGTWGARAWLGEPGLEDGAPADVVVYAADPREDPAVLLEPRLILAAGRRVPASTERIRPAYVPWRERGVAG